MEFVLDRLLVGTFSEAMQGSASVDALLCVAAEKPLPPLPLPKHKVPIVDMQPIPVAQLTEAVLWIEEQIKTRRVLVFCNAGVGRSPSVVIAYLCCLRGFRFGEAVEFVARRKPDISTLPMLIDGIEQTRAELRGRSIDL